MRLRRRPMYRVEDFADWLDVVCEAPVREINKSQLLHFFRLAPTSAYIRRRLVTMRYCRYRPQWSFLFEASDASRP